MFFLSLPSQVLIATFLNRVTNNVGCHVADCAVDLGPNYGSFMSTVLRKTRAHTYCRAN
jgi:SAM-dependent MidA family methyltransferase